METLSEVLEEFSRVYPAATYTFTVAAPMDVAAMVVSGQADIGCSFLGRLPAGVGASIMVQIRIV